MINATQRSNATVDRSPPPSSHYTVRSGDCLSTIAARHHISLAALERANPQIHNFALIYPHQFINLPGGSYASGTAGGGNGGVGTGGVTSTTGGTSAGGRSNAAQIAEQYLNRNASDLENDRRDNLPMRAGIDTHRCCANFVSAVLVEAGQLPASRQTVSVAELNTTLRGRGWTEVSAANARPGDVVIIQGSYRGHRVSHTEMISGNGQMIGSNNRNADGSQRVTHDNLSWALAAGAKILRAPAGTQGTTIANGPVSQAAPTTIAASGRIPQAIVDAARASQAKWGVPASVSIAQWALESGYGRSMPRGSNNPFGIKATAGQSSVAAATTEEINGHMVHTNAGFRRFDTIAAAFDAHGRLLATGRAYAGARPHTTDANAYADALTGHYATDSAYGAKLQAIMRSNDLYRYDR